MQQIPQNPIGENQPWRDWLQKLPAAIGTNSAVAPVVVTTSTYNVSPLLYSLIFSGTASCTVSLPTPSTNGGKVLWVKTTVAYSVVSSASNVVPLAGGSPGTAILSATAGKWAMLQSDGSYWQIMASN